MEAAAEAMASFAQPAGGVQADPAAVDDFRAASRPWPPTRRKACPLGLETSFPGRLRVPESCGRRGVLPAYRAGATTPRADMATINDPTLRRQRLDT